MSSLYEIVKATRTVENIDDTCEQIRILKKVINNAITRKDLNFNVNLDLTPECGFDEVYEQITSYYRDIERLDLRIKMTPFYGDSSEMVFTFDIHPID